MFWSAVLWVADRDDSPALRVSQVEGSTIAPHSCVNHGARANPWSAGLTCAGCGVTNPCDCLCVLDLGGASVKGKCPRWCVGRMSVETFSTEVVYH